MEFKNLPSSIRIEEHVHYLKLLLKFADVLQPNIRNALNFAIECVEATAEFVEETLKEMREKK